MYAVLLHYGEMNGVASLELLVFENNSCCALDCHSVDGKHFIDHPRQGTERWLDSITPLHRHVAVKALL